MWLYMAVRRNWKITFLESAILNFFCFIPRKINHKLCVRMDGTQFLWLWWITAKNDPHQTFLWGVYVLLLYNTTLLETIIIDCNACYYGLKIWSRKVRNSTALIDGYIFVAWLFWWKIVLIFFFVKLETTMKHAQKFTKWHGLFISLFKLFIHWIVCVLAYLNFIFEF